jgi:transcriptional regulator with XRE-family HTH domain
MPKPRVDKEKLKAARKWSGLTQKQAAKRLGLSVSTWSKLESGQPISISAARALALQTFIDSIPAEPHLLLPGGNRVPYKKLEIWVSPGVPMEYVARRLKERFGDKASRSFEPPPPSPGSDNSERTSSGQCVPSVRRSHAHV